MPEAPGRPNIVSEDKDIQAQSLTVKWTAPADDGGSPITAYRVVILKSGEVIRNENTTDLNAYKEMSIGSLNISTNYTVRVYARNFVFEGDAGEKMIRTKFEGVPAAAEILGLPEETSDPNITVSWSEPENNGKSITQYEVYQRTVREDGTPREWSRLYVIRNPSVRQFAVQLEKGKVYEFVVTATNDFGESLKEEKKIKKITVLGGVPSAVKLTAELNEDEITLTWKEPDNNGATITKYSVYRRLVNDKVWEKLEDITDVSKREFVVQVDRGKKYEFAVTASNTYGESPKDNFEPVAVSAGTTKPSENRKGHSCDGIFHALYIAVITVLLIIIVLLSVMLWRLRRRLNDKRCPRCGDSIVMNPLPNQTTDIMKPSRMAQANAQIYATPIDGDYMPLHPSTRSWEIMREQVDILKVIGKGAFSQVAQATVRNVRGYQEYITVAVKMLKANAPASDRKDLLAELELMKKLKPHPHVIKLIGCVTGCDPLLVLIEYVPFGDLLGYLRKSRGLNDTYYKDPDVKPQTSLTAEQLMMFACQVADGMCYLSSNKIIHRDLAARNVLVGEGEKCKVTDFGMARNVQQDDIYTRKSRGRLPVKWTAYEALLYGTYTTQSDVWSYGVLLYEILTVGGSPYPKIKPREVAAKIQEGYRMPKLKHVDEKLYQIMLKCWEENPTDRPTFEKLKMTMKDMERNHRTYVNLKQYDDRLYANVNDLADDE